ncbi:receptor-like protein 12 [Cinnamomum micranthum f. kanehirae]|uniref:Receptor-like protein 12 n=1 Tax=Cinnamomum micranthum f. kanehirae TaxID=337451 RepID=A0A443PME3_9MAGN|nr:receptor-like protein 12 [Cinnamomum micranthum f. kanehirae]
MNYFRGRVIPKFIGSLKNLRYLNLSGSGFGGRVPHELGNLSTLSYLDLNPYRVIRSNTNDGTNVPMYDLHVDRLDWLSGLSSLQYLDMGVVNLNTAADWLLSINMLPSILNLHLSSSQLPNISTSLPHVNLTSLSTLDLSGNRLGPQIPTWVFNNSRLVSLDLGFNDFSYPIPTAMGNLCNLQTLNLQLNHFNGEINKFEESFKGCIKRDLKSLNTLILDNNGLSGGIPSSISHLSQLTSLHLKNNKLSGELPSSMMNCTGLKTLDLGENGFSGKIPKWIGERLSFLKFLILRSNKFHGGLPPHLSLLDELQVLDLSQNNLSGTIPESFGNFSAMRVANMTNVIIYSGGRLSGVESIWVFWKGFLYEYSRTLSLVININLSGNDLHGEIPKEITHLVGLQSLNLSRNRLIGTIPEDINDLQRIESLDLSWNQLSGAIPHSFSYLTFLSHLNLSHNNFSGRIPSSNQLDTINDSSIYMGNPLLCGPPLLNQCPRVPNSQSLFDGDKEAKDELEIQLFFISMGPGFVVGFWVVCGILLFKRSWRVAYYNFFDDMGDRLYVAVARRLAKFKKNKGLQGNRGLPSSTPKHVLHPRALPGHKSSL